MKTARFNLRLWATWLVVVWCSTALVAQEEPRPTKSKELPPEVSALAQAKRLAPDGELWIDTQSRQVLIGGEVCFREGPLEMFACLQGTKEHESVVALRTRAFMIHAALLAVGAEPGNPVQFRPDHQPATGSEIEVLVYWTDEGGKRRQSRAADWIKNSQTGQPLAHTWVFGGSGFWEDETTGMKYYMAEDGDVICVSNFPSALLDLPIESSQANEALLYEAHTENIPPLATEVLVVLRPVKDREQKASP